MTHLNPTKPQKWRKKQKDYGPAMSALTPLQRRYVEVLYEKPSVTDAQAVELAGYKGKLAAMRKMAQRLKNNPLVQEAIKEAGQTKYLLQLPNTINAVEKIVGDPYHKDHVKVLHGVLDRTGLHAVSESRTTVTHQIDRADLLTGIAALLEKHQRALPVITALPEPRMALPLPESEAPDSTD